jgi:hypothetical protein
MRGASLGFSFLFLANLGAPPLLHAQKGAHGGRSASGGVIDVQVRYTNGQSLTRPAVVKSFLHLS